MLEVEAADMLALFVPSPAKADGKREKRAMAGKIVNRMLEGTFNLSYSQVAVLGLIFC